MDTLIRNNTCCFTGHRPSKLPWGYNEADPRCLRLKVMLADVLSSLYGAGYRRFLCGMAEGCDMYFGEAVAALALDRPGVALEAVIPFEGQDRRWIPEMRRRYQRLTEACDTCTVLHGSFAREHFLERDRYMVDRSSLLLAVYNGKPGGTQYTVRYARAQGLEVVHIDPEAPTVGRTDLP